MAHPSAYDPYYTATRFIQDPNRNEINTLFVSGLPDDVKAREIHNLFRRRPGFESCQLKYTGRGNQIVAFATFMDHYSAVGAMDALNGVKFDPQTGSTLYVELARSNSRRIQIPGRGPYVVIDNRKKRSKRDSKDAPISDDEGESDDASDPDNPDSGTNDDSSEERGEEKVVESDNASVPKSEQIEKSTDGAQPCSTLFIANLGPTCTEGELKQVVSKYPGFNTLKMRARGGMPVAFADFEGIDQATDALNALQGSTLPSSDRGGMHIEYARSKMRKP